MKLHNILIRGCAKKVKQTEDSKITYNLGLPTLKCWHNVSRLFLLLHFFAHPTYLTAIGGNWKLFKGKPRSSTNNLNNNSSTVTVWIAEKQNLDELLVKFLILGAQNLQKLKHPNIVTVHKFEETAGKLYLVTERLIQSLNIFCHGKDKNYLKYLTSHVFDGLEFIHGPAKLFHGNINNENFYVTNAGIVKIAGFELSKEISNSSVPSDFYKIQNVLATPGVYHQGNSLPKQDLYALGGEIAKIFTGKSSTDLGKKTLSGLPLKFESEFQPNLDLDLVNLCRSLFSGSFVRLSKDSSLSVIKR